MSWSDLGGPLGGSVLFAGSVVEDVTPEPLIGRGVPEPADFSGGGYNSRPRSGVAHEGHWGRDLNDLNIFCK